MTRRPRSDPRRRVGGGQLLRLEGHDDGVGVRSRSAGPTRRRSRSAPPSRGPWHPAAEAGESEADAAFLARRPSTMAEAMRPAPMNAILGIGRPGRRVPGNRVGENGGGAATGAVHEDDVAAEVAEGVAGHREPHADPHRVLAADEGSKSWSRISGSMPRPRSPTRSSTRLPSAGSSTRRAWMDSGRASSGRCHRPPSR